MKRKSKLKTCKFCEQEIASNAKICPNCGAKNKKPLFKKWWFWLIIIFVFIGAVSSGGSNESKDSSATKPSILTGSSSDSSEKQSTSEEPPDIELSTDFEKSVYEIIKKASGKLLSINTVVHETSDEATVVASVICENDESVVNAILSEISTVVKTNDTNESIILTIGDIKEGDDAELLVMAAINTDGTIDITSMSIKYNSERNLWIRSQFRAWSGAHIEFEKLIIKNLNDEKSYEHIETTYRDVAKENDRDDVNKVLADAGYSQRVEIGDLFIQTKFSAKNAFGGTIKSVAYGIASYANNTITLIDIE